MPEAYPLDFPPHQPRTKTCKRAQFQVSFAQARDELLSELDKMKAVKIVISTNIPLRRDGLPYANQREPEDPGVAVYFDWNHHSYCFACDKWDRVKDNIRAIGLHLAALRGQERWGVGTVEQAFAGYQALPDADRPRCWWDGLNISQDATWEEVKIAYRDQAKKYHPDVGGDRDSWDWIQAAYKQAEQEFRVRRTP
jgi:DnaJ domain